MPVKTGQPAVDQALDEVRKDVEKLKRSSVLDGVQVDNIALTTTAVRVPHRLGRRANGYIIVGSTVLTQYADENAGKQDLDKYVYLLSAAPTTVSIWVY